MSNNTVSSILSKIFGTRAGGFYILLFAVTIGVATFIENDFGTSAAQKVVYQTKWFELLLMLFCGSLIYNIIKFRMIPLKKWALLTFHLSMIIIIIGAGVTRYIGYEGMMHIREGKASNAFTSAETYLTFRAEIEGKSYEWHEPILVSSLGSNAFDQSYQIGSHIIKAALHNVVPNPKRQLIEVEDGNPHMKIVLSGMNGREEYFLRQGDKQRFGTLTFGWDVPYDAQAINIVSDGERQTIQTSQSITRMVMATQERIEIAADEKTDLYFKSLYSIGNANFVIADYNPSSQIDLISDSKKIKSESLIGLDMILSMDGTEYKRFVIGQKGVPGQPVVIGSGSNQVAVAYGSRIRTLPFELHLYDFIMDRYPGTNSPASYASEVQLRDPAENITQDYRIYMNNILTHKGYRFFQSSYDPDEQGTYLSVNYDFWGTIISYIGYALLTIGMLWLFISKKSRFYELSQKTKNVSLIWFLGIGCMLSGVTSSHSQSVVISEDHAALFSRAIVQDFKGRMKPAHTLTRELLRKMSGQEQVSSQNADQVILGMYAHKESWLGTPLIKVGNHEKIRNEIGANEKLVAFRDFFNVDGSYKLRDAVRAAYAMQPIDRGTYEKDLLKVDERVNIAHMIFSGRVLQLIPVIGDPDNRWVSDGRDHNDQLGEVPVADKFFPAYRQALRSGSYGQADQIIQELIAYQRANGGEIVPSTVKTKAEILLNESSVFNRLSLYYFVLGILYLVYLFISVFKSNPRVSRWAHYSRWLVYAGFLFHTIGLGLRWYVSGRAPWSNGYESMIYIAWTTVLAGMIFTRKSLGGLAATMILSGTILLVAMLSYLDPEITPLVPVLRSYWLTIHVSLIAGSYGFLMLGAIIGVINLVMLIFITANNKDRVRRVVMDMTHISEMTLTGGLVMLSIGTYLGGVWANESWGRYWGWDAKETWALVTILVYAFILHMRIIPKAYSLYSYNVATLFGFASVVMTYFGVNYYLSGLHSYAAGDPIPIPTWVYISVVSLVIIGILAYMRKQKVQFK